MGPKQGAPKSPYEKETPWGRKGAGFPPSKKYNIMNLYNITTINMLLPRSTTLLLVIES